MNDAQRSGVAGALSKFDLQGLAGRSSAEILESVADVICPQGGPVDEGIARDAMCETVAELASEGFEFEGMTSEQIELAFEMFAARAIEGRILNDVGNKTITVAGSREELARAQKGMRELVRGAVKDAIHAAGGVGGLTEVKTAEFVDDVYELAYRFLGGDGE